MTLQRKNSKQLVSPAQFKWKVLVSAPPGFGKTTWAAGAPNTGFIVCETGHGKGLLTVADLGVDYIEPTNYLELMEAVDSFDDKDTIVLDSLTAVSKTLAKDHVLAKDVRKTDTPIRLMGVPDMRDYGPMGELVRRFLQKLLAKDKHIIVTSLLKPPREADVTEGIEAQIGGPDLPGQMQLGSAAMFDTVLVGHVRPAIRNPKDAATRYNQRYFQTDASRSYVAKCRAVANGKSLLAAEEVFDRDTGDGSWQRLFQKILAGYASPSANPRV